MTAGGGLINTLTCAPAGTTATICPDGQKAKGGCQVPATTAGSSVCENNPSLWPVAKDTIKGDGRIFNLFLYNGSIGSTAAPVAYAIPGTSSTVPMLGMFARVHQTLPIWDESASTTPPNLPGTTQAQSGCQLLDMTDQIACLTQADPCSVGYAGDGGKTWFQRVTPTALAAAGTDAMEVSQIYPTQTDVQSIVYPFWRKLYYNSNNGFDKINGTVTYTDSKGVSDNGEAELALGQYESNETNALSLLVGNAFFGLGPSSPAVGGADTPFCEDFNENMICSATTFPTNADACANNGTAGTSPSDPTLNPAVTSSGVAASNFAAIPSDTELEPREHGQLDDSAATARLRPSRTAITPSTASTAPRPAARTSLI